MTSQLHVDSSHQLRSTTGRLPVMVQQLTYHDNEFTEQQDHDDVDDDDVDDDDVGDDDDDDDVGDDDGDVGGGGSGPAADDR